ncbi:hypothetical protein DYB31_014532, partial [Aphanomyces astaci]
MAQRDSTTPVAGHGIHIHTTLLKKGDGTPVSLRRLKDDLDNARPHTSSSSMRPTLAPSLSSRAGPETSSISAAAAILEPLEWRPKTSATSSSGDLRRLSTHAHASLVSRQPSQQLLSQHPSDLHHHQPVFQIKTSSSVHRCFGCGGSPEMCLTCFSECKKSDMTKYKQSLAKGVEWLFAKATTRAFHHMSITMSRMIFGQVMNTPIKRVETLEVETDQLHGTVTELTKHSHVRSQLDEEKVAKLHATIEVERQRVAEKNKELAAVKMQLTAALATIERQLEDYSLFEGQQNLADILSGDVVNSLDFAEHPLLYDPTAKFAKENKLTDKTTKAPSPKKSKTDSPGTMSVATIDRADRILMQWDGKSYAVLTLTLHDAMCKMKSRKKDFSMNPLQRENGMALTDQAAERYVVRFALHDLSFLQGSIVQIAKWRELKDAADATNKDQTVSKKIKLALAHLFELKKKLDGDTRKAHDGHVLWWKSAR